MTHNLSGAINKSLTRCNLSKSADRSDSDLEYNVWYKCLAGKLSEISLALAYGFCIFCFVCFFFSSETYVTFQVGDFAFWGNSRRRCGTCGASLLISLLPVTPAIDLGILPQTAAGQLHNNRRPEIDGAIHRIRGFFLNLQLRKLSGVLIFTLSHK